MKRVRRGVYALLFALSLVASLVVPSGVASAASVYDTSYQSTDAVYQYYPFGNYQCPVENDLTTTWSDYILDETKWQFGQTTWAPVMKASFEEALENGRWGVSFSKSKNGVTDGRYAGDVYIFWTEDGSLGLNWLYDSIANEGYVKTSAVVYAAAITCARLFVGGDEQPTAFPAFGWDGSDIGKGWVNVSNSMDYSLNSSGGAIYNLFVKTDHPNYPVGYEGETIRSAPPSTTYVAMGDSYVSGEGSPPFEAWTDAGNVNGCHRSPRAYPRLLQTELNLGPTAFVACSGATTANITGTSQWNEPPQIDALSDETRKVTLGIGGNDVDFVGYAMSCSVACGPGSSPYNTIMGKINDSNFQDDLVDTYETILAVNEDLDLYVVDYPYLAEEGATTCWGLDFSGAYDVQTALNDVIFDAVVEVGLNSSRIFMVQTNYPGSPFEDGELCGDGTPLFNGLVAPPNLEYSLHPNAAGHQAYADVFELAMS